MTTLRRLLVAVYPIGLFLLAVVVWGETADVRAQSPIRVGYYDMTNGDGAGSPEQVAPILAAGFTPVLLDDVTWAELAGLHILFVQNPSPNVYNTEYLASRAVIEAAVRAGMVLVIHDRTVSNMATGARVGDILPGVTVPQSVSATKTTMPTTFNNIEVTDAATLIVNGPFGTITSSGASSLDGGWQSNHGTVNLWMSPNIPSPRKGLLHTGTSGLSQSVMFTYPLGAGHVIYSTIPIDMFLKGGGSNPPRDIVNHTYAPNVLTYAACGLKAFPATVSVSDANGHYGGTTTLTARVLCGVLAVAGVTVDFSINGVAVGSAQTDESGTATLANVRLGESLESAIAVGTYPAGVVAAFAGTALHESSSGNAALTVAKAPATITYTGGAFVYDATAREATGSVTGAFGESLGTPTFTYTDANGVTLDAPPVHAGVFVITAASAETDKYLATTASSSSITISIAPAPLTVTADDKTKLYGAALPAFTASYAGFVAGETTAVLTGTVTFTTDAKVNSPVGEYPITPSGLTADNYSITFVDGRMSVTPAPLKIRGENEERLIGISNPVLGVSYEGFVLGETAADLDIPPTVTTPAVLTSPAGVYPIVVRGASDQNYVIEHIDGELIVSPEGRIRGEGYVDAPGARHHFVFDARETITLGEKGSLTLRIDRENGTDDLFTSTVVTSVTFRNNPLLDPGGSAIADSVTFAGAGTWNGAAATFEAIAADLGEPGVGHDTVTFTITTGGLTPTVVSTTSGTLRGGNVQSNRLPGR